MAPHLRVIKQGNMIEAEQIAQLHVGMSKEDVTEVIGYPVLHTTFNSNKWEYVYSVREHRKKPINQRLILRFEQDHLTQISHEVDD